MIAAQFFRFIQTKLFDAQPTLVSNPFFNTSQLKPRIQMLINPKTNRRALWRYVLLLPVAVFLLMCSQKDAVNSAPPITGEILTVVEQNPVPPGGFEKLGNYLSKNLHYPAAAQKASIEGKVFVRFVVAADGHIADVEILKGLGYGCDEESVRVVKQMPDWTPGRQDGKPVNVRFNLPIRFDLEESSANAGSKAADVSLEKYTRFVIDGKTVDKATFVKAFGENPKEISDEPSNKRISITTR